MWAHIHRSRKHGGGRSWDTVSVEAGATALAEAVARTRVAKGHRISGRAMGGDGGRVSAGSSGLRMQRRAGGGRINVWPVG